MNHPLQPTRSQTADSVVEISAMNGSAEPPTATQHPSPGAMLQTAPAATPSTSTPAQTTNTTSSNRLMASPRARNLTEDSTPTATGRTEGAHNPHSSTYLPCGLPRADAYRAAHLQQTAQGSHNHAASTTLMTGSTACPTACLSGAHISSNSRARTALNGSAAGQESDTSCEHCHSTSGEFTTQTGSAADQQPGSSSAHPSHVSTPLAGSTADQGASCTRGHTSLACDATASVSHGTSSFHPSHDRFCGDSPASTSPSTVVLMFEALKNSHAKALVWWGRVGTLLSLVAMSILLASKVSVDFKSYRPTSRQIQVWNIVVGSILTCLLMTCMTHVAAAWARVVKLGGSWSHRRWRIFAVAAWVVLVQLLSLVAYLASNIVLLPSCAILTSYNTNIVMYGVNCTLLVVFIVLLLIQAQNKSPLHCQCHKKLWRWCRVAWRKLRTCCGQRGGVEVQADMPDTHVMVMDGSMWSHWVKFLFCIMAEGLVVWSVLNITSRTTTLVEAGNTYIEAQCAVAQSLSPVYASFGDYWCPDVGDLGINITLGNTSWSPAAYDRRYEQFASLDLQSLISNFCVGRRSLVDVACHDENGADYYVMIGANWFALANMEFYQKELEGLAGEYALFGSQCELALNNTLAFFADNQNLTTRWLHTADEVLKVLTTQEVEEWATLYDSHADEAQALESGLEMMRNVFIARAAVLSWESEPAQLLLRNVLASGAALYGMYIALACHSLKKLPYIPYRSGNVLIRWEVRTTTVLFLTMNLAWVLLWNVAAGRYAATAMMGLGGVWMPLQIAKTFLTVELCVLYQPRLYSQLYNPLQVQLQQFRWSESEPQQQAQAMHDACIPPGTPSCTPPGTPPDSISDSVPTNRCIPTAEGHATFCFETALKAYYWSCLAYFCHSTEEYSETMLQLALEMSGYSKWEKIHHVGHETAVVIGWSERGMVIAFRGTATLRNALTDLKGWMKKLNGSEVEGLEDEDHVSSRILGGVRRCGSWWSRALCCTDWSRSGVHAGFWSSWQVVKQEVLHHVGIALRDVTPQCSTSTAPPRFTVLITGHSMGGALSVVAGPDIANHIRWHMRACGRAVECNLCCYTFGAPRVVNARMSRACNKILPDTWHIINDQDIIPRLDSFTKLMVPYKRTGHQVIVNGCGDMIVRPSFPERAMWTNPFLTKKNVTHHLLKDENSGYAASLGSVIGAQLKGLGVENGKQSVQDLLDNNAALKQAVMLSMPKAGLESGDQPEASGCENQPPQQPVAPP